MKKFDLIIIGGGAGGFAAAIKANELGKSAVMINHGLPLGGTCVNVGCVPSKTLIHAAETVYNARKRKIPGIEIDVKSVDFPSVIQHELDLVDQLRKEKYEKVIQGLEHVSVVEGSAKFVSSTALEVNGERHEAPKTIIATGSTATPPRIEGIEETGYITHIEALKEKELPKSLTILGAGPVGLEFAQVFARFGTKVTILARGNSIFSHGEEDLTKRLQEILENEGINIKTNVQVQKAYREDGKKVLVYKEADLSAETLVKAEEILIAAGKTPNTKNLNLEAAGVEIDEQGAIKTSPNLQTSNPNIYAVGDVNNLPLRLETTAGKEGTLASENALTGSDKSLDYNTIPFTIFTDPQYASVGYTEDEQMRVMKVCSCRTVEFNHLPKARILDRTDGAIKMAVHPKTEQIMGVHILSPNAGDLIAQAMTLIANKNTLDDVISSAPVFPTLSEAIKLVATSFKKDISKLSCCT